MVITLNKKAEEFIAEVITEAEVLGLKRKHWHEIVSNLILELPRKTVLELAKDMVPDDIVIQNALIDEELKREIALLIRRRAKKKAEAVT